MQQPATYYELLERQEKELQAMVKEHFIVSEQIKRLQQEHYDPKKYEREIERLDKSHTESIKELQERFKEEQRVYLGEPMPTPISDISDNQDKAVQMIKDFRNSQKTEKTASSGTESSSPKQEDIDRLVAEQKQQRAKKHYWKKGQKR